MRRPSRLGLIAAILLLAIAFGGYTVFWFVAAGRVEARLTEAAEALRARRLELTWKAIDVGGYPLQFRVALSEARLAGPSGEVQMPRLLGTTPPWNFRQWHLAAPQGLTASASAGSPLLTAPSASGAIWTAGEGGAQIWLALENPVASFGPHLAAKAADIWLSLPARPPQAHTEPALGLAFDLHEVTLPIVPPPFKNPLEEFSLGVTVMGAIPAGAARPAAIAWRDAGGTLELDHLAARWGSLAVTGSGTLALDRDLQPEGAFSGGVEGYDQLMTALVAAGRMRESDARLARLALTMLAKPGPDGRPQIPAAFTIQDGQMSLGPAKLGPAPRINWE